jgi:hypothetical protein
LEQRILLFHLVAGTRTLQAFPSIRRSHGPLEDIQRRIFVTREVEIIREMRSEGVGVNHNPDRDLGQLAKIKDENSFGVLILTNIVVARIVCIHSLLDSFLLVMLFLPGGPDLQSLPCSPRSRLRPMIFLE